MIGFLYDFLYEIKNKKLSFRKVIYGTSQKIHENAIAQLFVFLYTETCYGRIGGN